MNSTQLESILLITLLTDYQCSDTKLQQLVMKYGSAMTGIHASDNGFSNYKSGVFDKCNP